MVRSSLAAVAAIFALSGAQNAAHADEVADCTLLHEAAFLDEPAEVQDLLSHGVNVECRDVLGQTPLVTAVNGASLDSFEILMRAGAKVNVRTEFGESLLKHTKKKFRSVDHHKGMEHYRDLYRTMIAQLQTAGATN